MNQAFVLFEVQGASYAVRSSQVQQVDMVETITRVPNAPDFVEGVVPIRGKIIPVISLRRRFQLPSTELTLRSRVLVIQADGRVVGMLVDAAREFIQIDTDQIVPPPEDLSGPGVEYLQGIVHQGNRLILIVDLPRLLNPAEATALDLPMERN